MAYSSTLYSDQTAGKTDFTLVFSGFGAGYIDSSHVKLYRNDVLQDGGFTFTDETNVVLTTPTVAGENILFRRETPKDAPLVDFDLDTALTDADLDTISLQMLYIAHEVLDGYITLGSAGYTSFNSRRLTDVGEGTLDTDGVNLAQVISLINDEVMWSAVEADEILARLVTVDGAGSGVDADLLDGEHADFYATAEALATTIADVDAAEEAIEALQELSVSSSVTYTIGAGGDFATHSKAFTFLADKHPVHAPTGVTVTLHTLSGYVVNEQILIDGKDFGWVTLTGADAITYITPSALTTEFTSLLYGFTSYPFIGVRRGGVGPVLKQVFRFSTTPASTTLYGITIAGPGSNMTINNGGVRYAGVNLALYHGATCNVTSGSFDYALDTNIVVNKALLVGTTLTANSAGANGVYGSGAIIHVSGITSNNNAQYGVSLTNASHGDISSVVAQSNGKSGIRVTSGSIARSTYSNVASNTEYGCLVGEGSVLNAWGVVCTGCGISSIRAVNGSIVTAYGTQASSLGSYEYFVDNGGIIDISDYTSAARCNVALNTWTSKGSILN